VLVHDLPRLLVGLGVVALTLERGQRAQRRAGDPRPVAQELERRDQRVAAEQGVVAARVARLDGRAARVRPALGAEQRVDRGDAVSP
jgi:hypothetical protein